MAITLVGAGRFLGVRAFLATATLSMVTGCTGAAQVAPSNPAQVPEATRVAQSGSAVSPDSAAADQVIVSDTFAAVVSVFDAKGHLQIRLKKGISEPLGLTTDPAGNLYVANAGDSNVLVYSQPYKSPGLVLNESGRYPTDVAVSKAGVVAVTNSSLPSGPGNVTFYPKGSATACANVSDPNWNEFYFAAFDASGNLFVDGFGRDGNVLVGEIQGGCSATSVAPLSVANTLSGIGTVQVVNGNVLILAEAGSWAPVVYTYAPPVSGSLGSPITTTNLSQGISTVSFAMVRNDRALWIVQSVVAYGRIKYTYPGGRFVKSFKERNLKNAFGIAVNPAARP
jgi:hypothetical protein